MKKDRWIGTRFLADGKVLFRVWAPFCSKVEAEIWRGKKILKIPLKAEAGGYYSVQVPGLSEKDRYQYVLDEKKERSDPVSRFQPDGVHGPSALINPSSFRWRDSRWKGFPLKKMIFYELHIGLFTPAGTFESAIGKIPYLKKLGITCIEIMPVAQFPGKYNWGYDGAEL